MADKKQQWTLKGLSSEVVEATRSAAQAKGMKLNAFVEEALREAVVASEGGQTLRTKLLGALHIIDSHIEAGEIRLGVKRDIQEARYKENKIDITDAAEALAVWKYVKGMLLQKFPFLN